MKTFTAGPRGPESMPISSAQQQCGKLNEGILGCDATVQTVDSNCPRTTLAKQRSEVIEVQIAAK